MGNGGAQVSDPDRQLLCTTKFEADSDSTDVGGADSEHCTQQQQTPLLDAVGRPYPIIITASINLLKFQGELRPATKNMFVFRTTRNGIKVVAKDLVDDPALMHHLDTRNFP
jgi:hypothetical protein